MYYKDKKIKYKLKNFNQMLNNYFFYLIKLKSVNWLTFTNINNISRQISLSITLIIFIILIYIYKLASNTNNEIILIKNDYNHYYEIKNKNNIINSNKNSIIINAIVKQSDEEKPIYSLVTQFINGIYFYNMNEPIESWWPFECIETKMKHSINTQLCIHDPKFDKHISAQLKENGLWEPTNVRSFLRQLNEVPDANVMDIGANIGLYTLLAAKMNRSVIAVEPLHENLNRLHKAAQLESVQSHIIALVNAVSNERKQLKISIVDYNIGGSYVLQKELINPKDKFKLTSSSVIVNSILMDDLVDVFKIKINKSKKDSNNKKFVIKLDIEGYEPFIFEKAEKLFQTLEIVAIFMEFGKILEKLKQNEQEVENDKQSIENDYSSDKTKINYFTRVRNMLHLFKRKNFEPYEVNGFNRLDYDKWREWPWDIYLRQCDLINCPDHVYKVSGI